MMHRSVGVALCLVFGGCTVPVGVGALDTGTDSSDGGTTVEPVATVATDSATSSTTNESDTGNLDRHDFAIRFGDIPPLGGTSGTGGSGADSTGGNDIDPDTLLVTVGIGESTCDEPFAALPCGMRWELSFNLPPDLQVAGAQGALADVNGLSTETGPGTDCFFGGGTTLAGSFEIIAIDGNQVQGRLLGLDEDFVQGDVDFTAPRC